MIEDILINSSMLKNINFKASKKGAYYFSGVSSNLKEILSLSLYKQNDNSVLYILKNDDDAKEAYEKLSSAVKNDKILFFPPKSNDYSFSDAFSMEYIGHRVKTISAALTGKKSLIVTSINALAEKNIFFDKSYIETFKTGDILDIDDLIEKLNFLGYSREILASGEGSYSVKGGIVDIFISGSKHPTRIEFFDDEIDSIRLFNEDSQISIEKTDRFTLLPALDNILPTDEINRYNKQARAELDAAAKKLNENISLKDKNTYIEEEEFSAILANYAKIYNNLADNSNSSTRYIMNMATEHHKNLIGLYKNPILVFDDYKIVRDTFITHTKQNEDDLKSLYSCGKILKDTRDKYCKFKEIEEDIKNHNSVIYWDFTPSTTPLFVKEIISVKSADNISYIKNLNYLVENITSKEKENYKIVITYANSSEKKNLTNLLANYKIKYTQKIAPGYVAIIKADIKSGCEIFSEKIFLLSYKDVLGINKKKKKKTKVSKQKEKAFFSEISKGDYIVHETYGIGKYLGMVNMEAGGTLNDYLEIQFAGDDKLYVVASKMNLVQKYIGTKDAPPRLNKLGTASWEAVKAKTKKAVKELASEYITLYAKRQEIRGYAFPKDTPWQKEFEDAFPYELTDDQERCVAELKSDMEKPAPMDRLLCGDVGFGKTEVAMRGVFKAVMDGKQAAILVPTTVLALQHYNTFVERFKDYPVTIEMLSRFKSKKEEEKIIRKLKSGAVDIVIGTHKILSDTVKFSDLGLLIIDEEQRFGVAHKDKLKLLKASVDTLSLSATPIPRTLNMSLIGIRDLSVIEQPPRDRLEVETYVMEYDNLVVKDAVERELARDGQVFFVYNNVKKAEKMCHELRALIPSAKITFANGQMPETQLEKAMLGFLQKEYNVLVSTSIVENGLNILNANTMIIKEGNNLGLSQLYQLRGRVGRSNRNAYAYITYEKDKSLNENAMKRLKAINEFTRFGSGFQIAMRDLQIRGAGNLLGANQSGHFTSVGYEMYTKMLSDALLEEKGEKTEEKVPATIDLKISAYIPASYIEDERLRILAYKEIAAITTEEENDIITGELIDMYGDMPASVENLLKIAMLKARCANADIIKIVQNEEIKQISFDFNDDKSFDMEFIDKLHKKYRAKFVKNDKFLRIAFPVNKNENLIKYIDSIISAFEN